MPKIKICCIKSLDEARMAIAAGAHALGLVSSMPSGPGVIDEALIAEIAAGVPASTRTFLLTSLQSADEIVAQYRRCKTTTIQIVDTLEKGTYEDIRRALPKVEIVQVIHVSDKSTVQEALAVSNKVDAILLDSGKPGLPVKELGGTGRRHNWDISRRIVRAVKVPVYLAGGLNSGNVGDAIQKVQPYGLDLCSGVRSNGNLDPLKLKAFFDEICRFQDTYGQP